MSWRLYLVEDSIARSWSPITETRPAGEIRFGALLLRQRIERAVGLASAGYLWPCGRDRGTLVGTSEAAPNLLPQDTGAVLLSSRYVPPAPGEAGWTGLIPRSASPRRPARLTVGGAHMGWLVPRGVSRTVGSLTAMASEFGAHAAAAGPPLPDQAADIELPGTFLEAVWNLVDQNPERLMADLRVLCQGNAPTRHDPPPEVARVGPNAIRLGAGVVIDPGAVLDTRTGPIYLSSGVTLRPHTYLRGPAWIGEETTLLGGAFDSLSCGPGCKLRGEISHSILHSYVNKAHDGYLGHSMVGSWVNLGAMTTNSDLKNNYGSVRVGRADGEIDTGLLKLGVFLGDHVKTGIGTRLNAGTCVGAGTNLFGRDLPKKWIPPLLWGEGTDLTPYRLEAFLAAAERVMSRRGARLDDEQRTLLRQIWLHEHGTDPVSSD